MSLSPNLPWAKANPLWAAALNPLLSNPLNNSVILIGINLISGVNTFNHTLGRTMRGWIVTDINAAATIYRSQPLNANTLTLTSNAVCTINLEVF